MTRSPPGNADAIASAAPFPGRRHATARSAAAIACVLTALAPLPLSAVGLGPITQQSALGQSLRVVVPVTLAAAEDIPSECFKLASAQLDADGIPQVLFGRVAVERTSSGMQLVVTNARPVNDPIVRLTLQAGCETSIRREYTLFMDPPAIEPPLVAVDSAARDDVTAPRPPRVVRDATRAAGTGTRAATRSAPTSGTGDAAGAIRKPAPPKTRAGAKAAPKRPSAVPADRPRLTLSGAAPGAPTRAGTGATTGAEREKAQQNLANSIEAETVVLQQRIVELTAMVERMQQEVSAQEMAQRAADEAAKAPPPPSPPPPAPDPDWWDANASLLAAIVGLGLLIAAGLLWKRRQGAARDDNWRSTRAPAPRAERAPGSRPAPLLRNAPAGLPKPDVENVAPALEIKLEAVTPVSDAPTALAVSELSQVTEEARVYVALGHHDRAIEVLHGHIRQFPRSMPAAWLMLLDLYHTGGRRQEFGRLAEEFHLHFNVQAPLWEGFVPNAPGSGGLDLFPRIVKQVAELWRSPECRVYLERLLYDNREGRRIGFPLSTYADILLLLQILDAPAAIDLDLDLAEVEKPDLAPHAPDTPSPLPSQPRAAMSAEPSRVRKPMPPDPSATARAVQQPIKFELDPDTVVRSPGEKPQP